MPLNNYSVLKGRPIDNRLATGASPHYQVLISDDDGVLHRIAINVRSQDGSEVEYLVRSHFEHPLIEGLAELSEGLHKIPSKPGGLALDFIRGNIAQPSEFQPLPLSATGPDNDLNEKLDTLVQRAMADENVMVYAFGDTWGPEKADRYFGFKPGRGIHDIHFNQGNPPGRFAESNGPWQDGGLIFEFPREQQWSAIFLKFQTQEWHSDDATGGTIDPPIEVADGLVRIIAAYVNDVTTPERETVTLLNTAAAAVGLDGWVIMDRQKNRMILDGSIEAGATRLVQITQPVSLSNRGGIITLLNDKGLKIHGVSYTKDQAREPGRTIPFQV